MTESDLAMEYPATALVDRRVVYAPRPAFVGMQYRLAWSTHRFDIFAECTGDRWVIRDRQTGIFGHGADPLSAVQDFQAAASEHLDVLERQPALSDELTAQLEYLRVRVPR